MELIFKYLRFKDPNKVNGMASIADGDLLVHCGR